ncbi:bifunctional adenosylcobinamide kinase/adenosylcobinamide-phosphate guanylyltransferase [Pontivivens ytuae]|uniref:bifunctional adenosylcobinamide kinase/adenosylcobinamide-phosphate guanylyltransferase n=1 Tax=Pontivivens ytuae TaxID=2789856 RepID=UPI003BAE9F6D
MKLVLGGARSGKSAIAERLVRAHPGPWWYVATAQAFDDEMRARIAQHVNDRGDGWVTTEEPLDLVGVLEAVSKTNIVLIDCLTLWLSNVLLGEYDLGSETDRLVSAISRTKAELVIVSNEVGMGLVPDNSLGRQFRDAQGRLNQAVAAQAGTVLFVAAGLPLVLKGEMPKVLQ